MDSEFRYFHPYEEFAASRANLPHRTQERTLSFVTFRLVDALPPEFWEKWCVERNQWLLDHPEPHDEKLRAEYRERFVKPLNHRLDEGCGSCVLAISAVEKIVTETLHARDDLDYRLDAYAVAGNHVHALLSPMPPVSLSHIVQVWKSVTAHRILKDPDAFSRLVAFQPGRARPLVWQKESFDHLVRSPEKHAKFRAYILAHRGRTYSR